MDGVERVVLCGILYLWFGTTKYMCRATDVMCACMDVCIMYMNIYNRLRAVNHCYRHPHSSQGAPKLADPQKVLALGHTD